MFKFLNHPGISTIVRSFVLKYDRLMDFSQPFRALTPTLDGPVLRALARSRSAMTRQQIVILAGEGSEAGIRKVLNRLVEQGIVIQERIGTHYTYAANREHILWPAVEIVASAHDKLDERIRSRVEEWEIQPLSVELFGSVATGLSTRESDIDLMVVSPHMAHDKEDAWDQQIDDLRESVERWTGNVCEILVMDSPRLVEAKASQEPTLASPRVSLVGDKIDLMLPNLDIARQASTLLAKSNSRAITQALTAATSPETKRLLAEVAKYAKAHGAATRTPR